ncbi:MAG: RHS repeat-associated core domain-containing protein, partial [Bacteroidales bacterium]
VTDNNANVTQGFLYTPFGELMYEHNPAWQNNRVPKYAFNAKELDEENNMYYYSARYYAPPTFISRDPMFEKYPTFSPYAYCMNNPVKLIDLDGEWPRNGVNFYFLKANIGVGVNLGVGATAQRGIATDRHGMTHFSTYSLTHVTNQNLHESSSSPSAIAGGGGGISSGFERNFSANSFVEALTSSSFSVNYSGKSIFGGSVTAGDNSYGLALGIGFEIGSSVQSMKVKESISLSKSESNEMGKFSVWSVVGSTLKQDKEGNPYFGGYASSTGEDKYIPVTCSAVKKDGKYVPSGIWMSKEYKQSIDKDNQ